MEQGDAMHFMSLFQRLEGQLLKIISQPLARCRSPQFPDSPVANSASDADGTRCSHKAPGTRQRTGAVQKPGYGSGVAIPGDQGEQPAQSSTDQPVLSDSRESVPSYIKTSLLPDETQHKSHSGRYLLLCIRDGNNVLRLTQANCSEVVDDEEFFQLLRKEYYGLRRWWTFLKTVRSIEYIRFRVLPPADYVVRHTELLPARVVDTPDFPPDSEHGNYAPCKSAFEIWPPISPTVFAHLFNHPYQAAKRTIVLSRVTMKLKSHFRGYPGLDTAGASEGWGLHIVESFDFARFIRVFLYGMLPSTFITFLSTFFTRTDPQIVAAIWGGLISVIAIAITYMAFYSISIENSRFTLSSEVGTSDPINSEKRYLGALGLSEDPQRISWSCVCGKEVSEDVPYGTVRRTSALQHRLNQDSGDAGDIENALVLPARVRNIFQRIFKAITRLGSKRKGNDQREAACNEIIPRVVAVEGKKLRSHTADFWLVCANTGLDTMPRLNYLECSNVENDTQFFEGLRKIRRSPWSLVRPWTWMRKVIGVYYVKFELFPDGHLQILSRPGYAPSTKGQDYYPCQLHLNIDGRDQESCFHPIGSETLRYYFENPVLAGTSTLFSSRVTRKLRGRLIPDGSGACIGWGIELREGFDRDRFRKIGLSELALCVVAGAVWTKVKNDLQGGMSLAACLMIFVTFIAATVPGAVESAGPPTTAIDGMS